MPLNWPCALEQVDAHAIDHHDLVFETRAVHGHRGLPRPDGGHGRARDEVGARLQTAGCGRNGVEHLAVDDHRLPVVDDIDDGRLARDSHRFFERAEIELGADGSVETAFENDALAPQRLEPGDRERHRVRPGTKIFDAVLP